jgi:C4-dicarboxylate-binding protein DctP
VTAGRVCSLALIVWIALALVTVTARADNPSVVPLFISDTIASESAAGQAATRWVSTLPSGPRLKVQPLNTLNRRDIPKSGIVLAPLVQWNHAVPALEVLRLPFLYADLQTVHRAIDGELGTQLARASQTAGWKLLAIWDAGMTAFSGNQRYNRLPNLAGMRFALWEHDPLQETELRALDVWARVVGERDVQRMAQECLVNSRSATPAQMWREQLQRVHLDLTLTQDRYEGYMLAIPIPIWEGLPRKERDSLTGHLGSVTRWERNHAAGEQQQALADLRKAGMTIHRLDARQWQAFASRMPPWQDFLTKLDPSTADELITAAGTAAATGGRGGTREETPTNTLPGTDATE